MVLFFAHIPFVVNCTFQLNASGVVATTSPPFYNEPHKSHVLCVKAKPGMTYTSWSQHHFVVIGKPKRHVRKALHYGSQQWSSPDEITLLYYCLFAPHIYGVVLRAHSVRGEPRISVQRQRSGCNSSNKHSMEIMVHSKGSIVLFLGFDESHLISVTHFYFLLY